MTEVTVLVPAYRSSAFIAQTLASVREQSFGDFVVEIALEADDAASTERVVEPFLADPRFRLRVNPVTYGWERNVRRLLGRVGSPYFAFLAHDDLWAPGYLERLIGTLRARPEAAVAYTDIYVFGSATGRHFLDLPDGPLADRLLAYFLQGAYAIPWHGLARRDVLDISFPVNEFDGFAVDCEWTLDLLRRSITVRVDEPLYLKRAHDGMVSRGWRTRMSREVLCAALEHHRERMLALVAAAQLDDEGRALVGLAAEAALLDQWARFGAGGFDLDGRQRQRADRLLDATSGRHHPAHGPIAARAWLALSRHAGSRGALTEAERLARCAVAADPHHWAAWLELARLHLATDRLEDALAATIRVGALAPMALGHVDLVNVLARRLATRYPTTVTDGRP